MGHLHPLLLLLTSPEPAPWGPIRPGNLSELQTFLGQQSTRGVKVGIPVWPDRGALGSARPGSHSLCPKAQARVACVSAALRLQ